MPERIRTIKIPVENAPGYEARIKNVPLGIEVEVVYHPESLQFEVTMSGVALSTNVPNLMVELRRVPRERKQWHIPKPGDAPDVVGYQYGYRVFRKGVQLVSWRSMMSLEHTVETRYTLSSLAFDYEWKNKVVTAECLAVGYDHAAPDPECECGFWAVYRYHDLPIDRVDMIHTVIGRVRAWGNIVEAPRGFRAQHMEVIELVGSHLDMTNKQIEAIGEKYKVPVIYPTKFTVPDYTP